MDLISKYRKKIYRNLRNSCLKSNDKQSNCVQNVIIKPKMASQGHEFEFLEHKSQSARASSKGRIKLVYSTRQFLKRRTRPFSAHSNLFVPYQSAIVPLESNWQETSNSKGDIMKNRQLSEPVPLPLPSPKEHRMIFKNLGSFRSCYASVSVSAAGPLPLPHLGEGFCNFSLHDISAACQNFSAERRVSECISHTVYKAVFPDDTKSLKKIEATVIHLRPSSQTHMEFVNEVTLLASLQHPSLCSLYGFHALEGSDERMVVYERLSYGSLDQLLQGNRPDCPNMDWVSRMKVALCAAKGLVFLHDEGPCQAMYQDFSAANIQVDRNFVAKLSGYGCVNHNPNAEFLSNSMATAYLSPESMEKGLLTPKSNVWSFGVMLLELLTGRKNMDSRYPLEERNIVKWSRPFLSDDSKLLFIVDKNIKGKCPPKAARMVAEIALKCLQKDPSERPTMRAILESLKNVQDKKHPNGYPLQEPSAVTSKHMLKCPRRNGLTSSNVLNFSSLQCRPTLSRGRASATAPFAMI